jgi:radical SAM family uncharacterized protein/radical SAM-linked protein
MTKENDYSMNYLKIEREILPFVEKPSRYIGAEFIPHLKNIDENIKLKFCLIFPDLYEIGMSALGIKLLFHFLNQYENILVDIAFMPKKDFSDRLKDNNLFLYSLGYKIPIKDFDIIGFSLNYELCYTNMLSILDYSGISLNASSRDENDPIVIAGGCCSSNPAPISKFIDLFSLGDGEETLKEISDKVIESKLKQKSRNEILKELSLIEGVFVPKIHTKDTKIYPRYVKNLDNNFFPTNIISPIVNTVHQHLSIEIQRGCFRSCKFCHASFINRSVRTRNIETIKNLINESIEKTGSSDISLLSLSVIDHPEIKKILEWFIDNYYTKNCSISLPSLRCDKFSLELADLVNKNKKSSLTFAPEAGSQRLRDYIGKNVTEEDILSSVGGAYEKGWKLVKLYFMYGLPSETMEDLQGIIDLILKIKEKFRGLKLNIGISSFVPKAHTPFSWVKQENLESLLKKKKFIIESCRETKIAQVKHSRLEGSIVEGLMARGNEKVADIIESAWRLGAKFDQWEEFFDYNIWLKAGLENGLEIENYVCRDFDLSEIQPWENINYGIERTTLQRMSNKIYTTHKPESENIPEEKKENFVHNENMTNKVVLKKEIKETFKYRVKFEKQYILRFISHLEFVDILKNSLLKADIDIAFSQGFHPLPKISCNLPLSVGFIGENEWFDFESYKNFDSLDKVLSKINQAFPNGLFAKSIKKIDKNELSLDKILKMASYEINCDIGWDKNLLEKFLESKEFLKEIEFKKGSKSLDLKKIVYKIDLLNDKNLEIILNMNEIYVGLYKVLNAIFGISEEEFKKMVVIRKGFFLGNGFGALIEP